MAQDAEAIGGMKGATTGEQRCETCGVQAHLVDPVRVEHAEAAQLAAGALLGHAAQIACGLQLRHALVHRLAVHNALQPCHMHRQSAIRCRSLSFPGAAAFSAVWVSTQAARSSSL